MEMKDWQVEQLRLIGCLIGNDWSGNDFDGRDVRQWINATIEGKDIRQELNKIDEG